MSVLEKSEDKLLIVLTQYKRNNLEKQLISIHKQTKKPDYLVVFQNENHVNIDHLKNKYKFIHVKSDYNTKYFGRFAYCFNFPVEYCVVMDDDIIPGKKCINKYIEECKKMNSIIGGNGRFGILNKNKNNNIIKHGIRIRQKVDFVGHIWCFKKIWLHYMFSIQPYTYDTGEDMHLCFSCKVLGNIDSYTAEHRNKEEIEDLARNSLAGDEHASFRTTPKELRESVEKYFIDNYKIDFVK